MSVTRILCNKCGFPQAWCNCSNERDSTNMVDMNYTINKTADPSFLLFRFFCSDCGNRIASTTAQWLQKGKPVEAAIEFEGEVCYIARKAGIEVEHTNKQINFRVKSHNCVG